NADIIISCVGKIRVVSSKNIKKGVILIGVGIRGEDGTVKGDYNEEEIEKIAGAYTPTPGGVGPVNLSYLFKNLVKAAMIQNQKMMID
ncbi:MAG: bifunctional 5,10-methylene-tetrahydrofolate dehydrogenase/5,10-methylene-tetrahydrofolate cyclohydrolase, partial [Candidatus Levybacteria bacterium]|nr:bifunctional 5,10-methylene-tetrahydrofolate dehydrogenase/5,10-methylene-tetrahydrofolate cyclohydrolase [Candidatus Levybacteria bacterium]